jgi:hypothetical protein
MRRDGRTDMTKLIGTYRNLRERAKKKRNWWKIKDDEETQKGT